MRGRMRHVVFAALLLTLPSFAVAQDRPVPGRTSLCAIDMGSNTFKRIVGSFENGRYEQRRFEKRTLGVGDDLVRHGAISEPKLAEIAAVLAEYRASCERDGASGVRAVGTAAFRDAPNGRAVVDIAAKLGIAMEIATEARESELAYLVGSLGRSGYAVVDNGSRTIELVSSDAGAERHTVFPLGYRVAFEKFFSTAERADAAVREFQAQLRQQAASASFMKGRTKLVGVEFAEMAEILFKASDIEGRVFTLASLKQKVDEIAALSPGEFELLKKTKEIDRALPRLVVAAFVTEAFGYRQIELTERELGSGLIIEAGRQTR